MRSGASVPDRFLLKVVRIPERIPTANIRRGPISVLRNVRVRLYLGAIQ
jgi:hypothetical protein